jgi:mannitol/fructose-specific phosphotransferase system IIA component (Ntr-type)
MIIRDAYMSDFTLHEMLQAGNIRLVLKAGTKEDAIRELAEVIQASTPLPNLENIIQLVLAREQMMPTGLENGIAIPHGKTDTVDRLYVAMAVLRQGLDFNSTDGLPARIILLLVSPAARSGPHLRFMAEFSRLLQSAEMRQAILDAETPERVYALITGKAP